MTTQEHLAHPGLHQFLRTERSVDELKTALAVILEFKDHESAQEWGAVMFACWSKLEQLEDYLKLMTDTDVESVNDKIAKAMMQAIRDGDPTRPAPVDGSTEESAA